LTIFSTTVDNVLPFRQFIAFRFLSGLGGGAPLAIGAGVLSDLWRPEERGRAAALYSLGPLLGPGKLNSRLFLDTADVASLYSYWTGLRSMGRRETAERWIQVDFLLDDNLLGSRSRSRSLSPSGDLSSRPVGATSRKTQEVNELAQNER